MPIQKAIGYMGVAKQSGKGSAASAASFLFNVMGGAIATVEVDQKEDELSASNRWLDAAYREKVDVSVEVQSRLYTGSAGLWLLGALGSDVVTGAGDPYSHAFATAAALPYLTVFGSFGASDAVKTAISDVKVDEIELKWSGSAPVELTASGIGTTIDPTGAAFVSGATDERAGVNYFVPVGGTFTIDAVGATPAAAVITEGSIKIANNAEAIFASGAITAADVFEGRQKAEIELTVIPDNATDWIEIMTGSTTGSAPTGDVQYGSFSIAFAEHGTGTHTLTVASSKVAWVAELPEIDPNGGPAEMKIVGTCYYNATNSDALDVTLTSATATY